MYVACDSTPSILLRNNHNGTFTDTAVESGAAVSEDAWNRLAWGWASGDFDLDGKLDILETPFADDTNALP